MGVYVRLVAITLVAFALLQPWLTVPTSSAAANMVERSTPQWSVQEARAGRLVVGLNPTSRMLRTQRRDVPQLLQQRWGDHLKVSPLTDGTTMLLETQSDLTNARRHVCGAILMSSTSSRTICIVRLSHLTTSSTGACMALPRISAPAAWDITTGSASVTVAVVDTGVYAAHPDLRQNMLAGANFVDGTNDASDDEGHGTHTAGIIAAIGNNRRGVAGVCWQCKILPVKALDDRGAGSAVDVSAGIRYAADRGAKVINLSLGGENDSRLLHDSIIYATSRGALVIVAAGNEALSGNPVEYPAAYNEVIAVGATDYNDAHASFSNYGDYLDIAAPGVDIGSTIWFNGESEPYASASGTSEAAPFVGGVAALVWSVNPSLSNQQVRQILLSTADDLGAPGRDAYFGAGRVNAYRAVQAAAPRPVLPTPVPQPSPSPTPADGAVLTFPETGHTLRGEFRRFWETNGGLAVFGFPISEQQVEQTAEGIVHCAAFRAQSL